MIKLAQCKSGNFAVTMALLLPVILGALGLSFDYVMLSNKRRLLQASLDSASLSSVSALAAKDVTTSTVKTYALNFVAAELAGRLSDSEISALTAATNVTATQTTSGTQKTYTVSMTGTMTVALTPFSQFIGWKTSNVSAASTTSSVVQSTAISAYLVLDRSGSMSFVTETKLTSPSSCQNYTLSNWGYYPNLASTSPCYMNKIAALKQAASKLFDTLDQIEAIDSTDSVVRSGAVSFTDSQQTPSNLAWGTTGDRNYVTALPAYPTGGTDMTTAMDTAFKALTASAENTAQASKGNTNVEKFIILMTDGENTGASSTWKPALDDETLTTCKAARDAGITIYTVAFMAPDNGKALLLSCSGNPANAYQADSASDLVDAFKAIGNKISSRATRITG